METFGQLARGEDTSAIGGMMMESFGQVARTVRTPARSENYKNHNRWRQDDGKNVCIKIFN